MKILEILQRLAKNWSIPRKATHRGVPTPFALSCVVATTPVPGDKDLKLPDSLADLWRHFNTVRLFEDKLYGQWGLVVLSTDLARERTDKFRTERARDYIAGDVVIGEFLGDSDVLIVRCDPESDDFGRVLVALPLDGRLDWHEISNSIEEFLEKYEESEGAKFWEET